MADDSRTMGRANREKRLAETSDDVLATSDDLLERIRELRRLEGRKRAAGISSEEFHRLAEEVERHSREIWQLAEREVALAEDQTAIGNQTADPSERTVNAVDAARHEAMASHGGGTGGEQMAEPFSVDED